MVSGVVLASLALLGAATQFRASDALPKTLLDGSVIGLDLDGHTQMLVQVNATDDYVDACEELVCGELRCPSGFTPTKYEGHCCAYCVNPAIKIEPKVVGATGKWGAEKSSFCPSVWCFPTMCTKEMVMPSAGNGQCCPMCPK